MLSLPQSAPLGSEECPARGGEPRAWGVGRKQLPPRHPPGRSVSAGPLPRKGRRRGSAQNSWEFSTGHTGPRESSARQDPVFLAPPRPTHISGDWRPNHAEALLTPQSALSASKPPIISRTNVFKPRSQWLTPGRGALAGLSVIYTLVKGSSQFISQGSILGRFQTTLKGRKMGNKSWVQVGSFILSTVLIKARPLHAYFYFQAPHSEKWGCLEPSMRFWLGEAGAGHHVPTPPRPRSGPPLAGKGES